MDTYLILKKEKRFLLERENLQFMKKFSLNHRFLSFLLYLKNLNFAFFFSEAASHYYEMH